MKELDIGHHKALMLFLALVVLIVGIFFGVQILGVSGLEGIAIIIFGLLFLNTVLLYVLFTQVLHVRDEQERKVKRK